MSWDKFKIAQKFLQKANAIHPEDEHDPVQREKLLAIQDVYYDCYMSSFSREDLVKRLREVVDGKIEMPETEVDAERYRANYIREAQVMLAAIERGDFL